MGRNGSLSLGGNNQRTLLAALIAHPDRVVSVSVLADALWPLDPPRSEHRGVQTVVSRLRRALGAYRADVITEADGYPLAVTASNTDLVRFDERIVHARDEPPQSALDVLDDALALWRGPAFGSFADMPVVQLEAIRLDQQRLNTAEDRFQLLLDLGRYPAAIPELEAFVASEPLRERARAQLMQALYWTGRQPDALEVYNLYRGASRRGPGVGTFTDAPSTRGGDHDRMLYNRPRRQPVDELDWSVHSQRADHRARPPQLSNSRDGTVCGSWTTPVPSGRVGKPMSRSSAAVIDPARPGLPFGWASTRLFV